MRQLFSNATERWAEAFFDMCLKHKMETYHLLKQQLDEAVMPDGTPMDTLLQADMQQLLNWMGVNILMAEKCTPKTLCTYPTTKQSTLNN